MHADYNIKFSASFSELGCRATMIPAKLCSLLFVWCLLWLIVRPISAQDLLDGISNNSSRVIGHGIFSRRCSYTGPDAVDFIEWLHNGISRKMESGVTVLALLINPLEVGDAGEYICVVHFVDRQPQVSSAVFLNIYTAQSILAPATQRAIADTDTQLQCSTEIPCTEILFQGPANTPLASATLHQVNLEHQGMYHCLVVDVCERGFEIYRTDIELQVVVPPVIISNASVKAVYGNESATFTVGFLSSYESNTTVTWIFNTLPLPSQELVSTRYLNETEGMTSLSFPQLSRSNRGIYTVIIDNNMTVIPAARSSTRTSFSINVEVPPLPPSVPYFETFNSSLSKISWNLTNTTADAGPQSLIVNILGHPDSPINLDPSQTHVYVETEPGRTYVVTIRAINADGYAVSQSARLMLAPEPPSLTEVAVFRVNETAFNFTLMVQYTGAGGGSLSLRNILFREADTSFWNKHNQPSVELKSSMGTWYALVANDQFATISDVKFLFSIQNMAKEVYIIKMEVRQILVVPGAPENVVAIDVSSNSLRLQVNLSSIGTSPILAVSFLISGPDGFMIISNITENLNIGGPVEAYVNGLSPGTLYSVVVYATNAAGSGPTSVKQNFETLNVTSVLPLWIILVIAVVGSLVVVILLMLLLISCCCRRQTDRKINLASDPQRCQLDRPGPLGATDSIESVHASSSYCYSQKSMQGFILSPPPSGISSQPSSLPPSHTLSPTHTNVGSSTGPYSYVKPRLQNSPLESDVSIQSSAKYNHFNFHHSPERNIPHFEYSRSMPLLDDAEELSPTMPPNCATDV